MYMEENLRLEVRDMIKLTFVQYNSFFINPCMCIS